MSAVLPIVLALVLLLVVTEHPTGAPVSFKRTVIARPAGSVKGSSWSRARSWSMVVLVFGIQLGLIFWLSDRAPMPVRRADKAPGIRLLGHVSSELLALNDPTLFALPHREGFSGPAWLEVPPVQWAPPDWIEPLQTLPLAVDQLGPTISPLLESNQASPPFVAPQAEAQLSAPNLPPLALRSEPSRLRLEGGLAGQRLLTAAHLPDWPHTDILTNTIVQLVVDAAGKTRSMTLLCRSELPEADQYALNLARTSRFEIAEAAPSNPSVNPLSQLRWGRMVFEWHTDPTNKAHFGP
jgi:hypothetical protein